MISLEATSESGNFVPAASTPRPWDVFGWLMQQLIPAAELFHYSCPTCFTYLWSLLDDEETVRPLCDCCNTDKAFARQPPAFLSNSTPQIFVIAYDDIPSLYARPESIPNIHLDSIFSPTTLFMLLRKKLSLDAGNKTNDPIRWIIIDPQERVRTDKDSLAISELLAPHIQVIDGSEASLLAAVEQALETATWDPRKAQAAEDHLKLMVTAPGNRHAVSNVVGPVLLGFQPSEPEVAWIVSLLRQVLSCVGLAPPVEEGAMLPSQIERQKLTTAGSIEFVLIDDQHRNGWGQIVRVALGVDQPRAGTRAGRRKRKPKVAVTIHDSPEFLVSKLEKLDTLNPDQRFGLTVGSRKYPHEVLLLDLRLFEGYSLKEEAAFLRRVFALAERFRERPGLPWPGFSKDELKRIGAWLQAAVTGGKAERSDKVYLEALTLLPRVLSLSDLSLPIVIFSSTGQREITERLKYYGNIITDFEKPRLFGYQSRDIILQTRAAFWLAIDKALLLSQARTLCAEILRTSQSAEARPASRDDWSWSRHFELYVDESGSASRESDPDVDFRSRGKGKRFVLAGILVPYASSMEQGPRMLHEKMELAGLRWWPENEAGPYLLKRGSHRPDKDLPGGQPRAPAQVIADFLKCLEPAIAAGVCLEYSEDIEVEETDNVRLQSRGDNRYRQVLSDLLELVLFDLLPTLGLNPEATLSIFVATRFRSKDDFRLKEEWVKIHRELFGYAGDDGYTRVNTIEESSILPLLFEVLARRHPVPLGFHIEHARGVQLFYPEYKLNKEGKLVLPFNGPKWLRTRHQHYLADTVANQCYQPGDVMCSPDLKRLFENGIYDKKDRRLATFMLAARLISRGEIAEALLAMKDSRSGSPLSTISGAALIFQDVARVVREVLNGDDFLKLVAGLRREKQSKPSRLAAEKGTITAFDEGSYTGTVAANDGRKLSFNLQSWSSATFPVLGEKVEFKRSLTPNGISAAVSVRAII